MAAWFFRGLRRGVVTTRYPNELDSWSKELPSPPAFHAARLTTTLADRLVEGCASGALERRDSTLIIDLGKCTGCRRCVELSGGVAEPSGKSLLASTARGALLKSIPILGDKVDGDGHQ
jgi:dissimilatory sulfite reductase (desulfoviridin) alpha/beta subunit